MKENDHLNLQIHEKQALDELKSIVNRHYPNAKFILFGSKTRDNFEEFSDLDLLILLNETVNNKIKTKIIGLAYELELKYEIVFGLLIESKQFWNSSIAKAMPIHWNIDREGVLV